MLLLIEYLIWYRRNVASRIAFCHKSDANYLICTFINWLKFNSFTNSSVLLLFFFFISFIIHFFSKFRLIAASKFYARLLYIFFLSFFLDFLFFFLLALNRILSAVWADLILPRLPLPIRLIVKRTERVLIRWCKKLNYKSCSMHLPTPEVYRLLTCLNIRQAKKSSFGME